MTAAIFDSSVLVTLAQSDTFNILTRVTSDRLVTNIVNEELTGPKYPVQVARYESAKSTGLLRVEELVVGSPAYTEFLRLRANRTNPARDRGEDSCIALAKNMPGSVIYIDDGRATSLAKRELGDGTRVRSSKDI